ncbi:MAG: DUF6048 family protein [Bacteroidales bacterium]|nr:DUF6048 family protein [Bacteroidales bacterium]
MKRKNKYCILLLLFGLLMPLTVVAQQPRQRETVANDSKGPESVDSIVMDTLTVGELVEKVQVKKKKKVHFLNGVAVGADFVGLAMRLMGADWSNAEVMARINILDKYFPIVELGLGYADHEGAELDNHFSVSAPYYRAGMDYNINKKHNGNRLMIGLRYGFSTYTYDIDSPVPLTDPYWGESRELNLKDLDGHCHWAEIVVGLETRLWTIVHLGWDIRLKFRLKQKMSEVGMPWYIPGYGKSDGATCWGGTFKLMFDI